MQMTVERLTFCLPSFRPNIPNKKTMSLWRKIILVKLSLWRKIILMDVILRYFYNKQNTKRKKYKKYIIYMYKYNTSEVRYTQIRTNNL